MVRPRGSGNGPIYFTPCFSRAGQGRAFHGTPLDSDHHHRYALTVVARSNPFDTMRPLMRRSTSAAAVALLLATTTMGNTQAQAPRLGDAKPPAPGTRV